MKVLTLKQVLDLKAEMRDKWRGSFQTFSEALWVHREALLDAAERVARQEAYAAEPDGYDSPELAALQLPDQEPMPRQVARLTTGSGADDERVRARIAELAPEFYQAFNSRPLLIDRDAWTTNPRAATLPQIEAWYLARGVRCTVEMVGKHLNFVHASLVPVPCPTCRRNDGYGHEAWCVHA